MGLGERGDDVVILVYRLQCDATHDEVVRHAVYKTYLQLHFTYCFRL